MNYMEYIIIAFVMIIILFAVIKATKKDAGLDFNKCKDAEQINKRLLSQN